MALHQYDTAIQTGLTNLLDKRGDKGAIHNNLGIAYFLKSEFTQAALNFEQAAQLRPDDKGVQKNMQRALQALGRATAPGQRPRRWMSIAFTGWNRPIDFQARLALIGSIPTAATFVPLSTTTHYLGPTATSLEPVAMRSSAPSILYHLPILLALSLCALATAAQAHSSSVAVAVPLEGITVDANTPYARVRADRSVVDHIQYPAETLAQKVVTRLLPKSAAWTLPGALGSTERPRNG